MTSTTTYPAWDDSPYGQRVVLTADDVVTMVTGAAGYLEARLALSTVPAGTVRIVADQLHIDPAGHGLPWLRSAIVREARA